MRDLPVAVLAHILKYLPVFDIHNYWRTNVSISKTKCYLKELIAKCNDFDTYEQMQSFYRSIKLFGLIDVKDTENIWSEACIVGHQTYRGTINIKVKYLGFSDRWNEWLRADNGRVMPHGSKCYNGTNELQSNNRIIYYHRGHWLNGNFIALDTVKKEITFRHKDVILTVPYIPEYLAPISRRGILLY